MVAAKSRTRSGAKSSVPKVTAKSTAEALEASASTTQRTPLERSSTSPPKIFILPNCQDPEARIISLSNPRTSTTDRYFYSPSGGLYEFTKIAAPKTSPSSILLSPSGEKKIALDKSDVDNTDQEPDLSSGYVTQSADTFVATPIDPLFVVLPALCPEPVKETEGPPKQLFLSLDDHLDALILKSPHLRPLVTAGQHLRCVFEQRISIMSDAVDVGDEKMYRLSSIKLFNTLIAKAQAIVKAGLPASMEEKLVRKALEVPIQSLKRGESNLISEMESEVNTPSLDSQTSTISSDTVVSAFSDASTALTEPEASAETTAMPIQAPEGIPHLLRLRTAIRYMITAYLPPHLCSSIQTILDTSDPNAEIDFVPLTAHLAHLQQLRQQAHASHETYSMKRTFEDEEQAEERRAKKARLDEEEKKKKAGMSRGVKLLAKVNTKGMKKMSDFFGKKA